VACLRCLAKPASFLLPPFRSVRLPPTQHIAANSVRAAPSECGGSIHALHPSLHPENLAARVTDPLRWKRYGSWGMSDASRDCLCGLCG